MFDSFGEKITALANSRYLVPLVLLAAFTLRIVYLIETSVDPYFYVPFADASYHDKWALKILSGDYLSLSYGTFWKPPLYPYFLALIYGIFGHKVLVVKLLQILAGLGSMYLLYLISLRYFDKKVAALALFISAFYTPFVYFECELETVTLFILINMLVIYFAGRKGSWPMAGTLFVVGALTGLAGMLMPTEFIFAPVLCLYLIWSAKDFHIEARRLYTGLALFAAGLVMVVLPVTLRNYFYFDQFVLVSGNSGVNLYIGNNPDYDSTVAIQPGVEWEMLVSEPARHYGRDVTFDEDNAYWYGKIKSYALSDPASFVSLQLKKSYLFLQGYEIKRNKDFNFALERSRVLSLPLFAYGLVVPLALIGIAISFAERKSFYLPYAFLLFVAITTVIFFVNDRYRLPAVPIFIMFASCAVVSVLERLGDSRQTKKIAAIGISFIGLVIALNYDFLGIRKINYSREYFDLGQTYSALNRNEEALKEFYAAIEANPPLKTENALTYLNIAKVARYLKRYSEADAAFAKSVEIVPCYMDVFFLWGEMHDDNGNLKEAEKKYLLAVECNGSDFAAYNNLGIIYARTGRMREAVHSFKKSLEINPDYESAIENLNKALGNVKTSK